MTTKPEDQLVALGPDEIFGIFLAVQALRRNSRTLDFAHFTMEDAIREAEVFIGGPGIQREVGEPLSQWDKLAILEDMATKFIDQALERAVNEP